MGFYNIKMSTSKISRRSLLAMAASVPAVIGAQILGIRVRNRIAQGGEIERIRKYGPDALISILPETILGQVRSHAEYYSGITGFKKVEIWRDFSCHRKRRIGWTWQVDFITTDNRPQSMRGSIDIIRELVDPSVHSENNRILTEARINTIAKLNLFFLGERARLG